MRMKPPISYIHSSTPRKGKVPSDADHCTRYGWVFVVAGEGIKYEDGTPVSASVVKDKFSKYRIRRHGRCWKRSHYPSPYAIFEFGQGRVPGAGVAYIEDYVVALPVDLGEAYCQHRSCPPGQKRRVGIHGDNRQKAQMIRMRSSGAGSSLKVAIAARPMPVEYFNEAGNHVSDAAKNI